MLEIKNKYCSRCKTTEGNFIKYCFTDGVQYHYCTKCQAERIRKYTKTPSGKLSAYRANVVEYKKSPEKVKARQRVSYAIKTGKIKKPLICSKCNLENKLEAHHNDYSKPLEVVWLCKNCHTIVERLKLNKE